MFFRCSRSLDEYGIDSILISQFNTDRFTIPFFVDPRVPAQGVLVVAVAAALTALLIRRRVDRLDLVRALKTRE